ncbi:MAG TPA: GerAB/ArcD/ProY family transporter [Pseudobacteroides sp.]|uniref:GerAB/ArcD/ProY family transporter n=1 Tax=Pseudobacteroides sp. TaxID=1968840 RepID=UPI002F9482C8
MNSEGKIGVFEAVCLTTLIMTNKVFFTSIAFIVQMTGTSAWYTTLVSCAASLIFFYFLYLLLKRFPGKDIPQIYEAVLGKVAGKFLVFLFCVFAVYYSGSTLREFVEMIKVYNLPQTPTSIIMISFLLVAVIVSYFGFECMARVCAICFIPTVAGLLLILLLASPSYSSNLLKPFGGYGIDVTLMSGFLRSSAYMEFTILTIVTGAIGGYGNFKKIGVISILLTGVIFSTSIFCYLLAFGYSSGSENISGIFELSRSIYFNRFFQRVESIFLFIWVISSVITTTVTFYISILIYCKIFKIKNHRPLILPFAVLVFIAAILPRSMQEITQVNVVFLRQYSMFVAYIPSIIVLIIAWIFKKRGQKAGA